MTKPGVACQRERDELAQCLIRTDCVLKQGRSPTDCLKDRQNLPLPCQHVLSNFVDCKKGMLDMRRRFRGNHLTEEAKRGEAYESRLAAKE